VPHAVASAEVVAELRSVVGALAVLSASLDPDDLTASDAAAVVEVAGRIERHTAAVRTLAVHQVAMSKVWRDEGARSCAAWLADKLGVAVGAAHRILGTAARVRTQPKAERALRDGVLSDVQADAVTGATEADPASEDDNLHAATHGKESVKQLRERRERAKARNEDADERARRLHRERQAHGGTGLDGAYRAFLQTTPLLGATFDAAWDAHRRALIAERQAAGLEKETWANLSADALIRMAQASLGEHRAKPGSPVPVVADDPTDGETARRPDAQEPTAPGDASVAGDPASAGDGGGDGGGEGEVLPAPVWKPGPLAQVHCLVDLTALLRGAVEGEERCEIAGIGPVPVHAMRALVGDANLNLILTRGKDVASITHRGPPTPAQRSAVYARAGGCCEIPGCPNTTYLEIDHLWERQYGGPTALWNLVLKCSADHDTKTRGQHRLIGPPGRRAWVHLSALPADPAKGHDIGDVEHLLPPPAPGRPAMAPPSTSAPPGAACPSTPRGGGQQPLHTAA